MVTWLVPVFGVAWGWLFLGESLTLSMAVGGALILGGMIFGQRDAKPRVQAVPVIRHGHPGACGDCG
jgi:drug/metabolite transporter (DMT)-like permease